MSDTIRVLVFKEGEHWIAQCLEYDIGAQAPDLDTLRDRLDATVNAERCESMQRHGEAFCGIGPAPAEYHDQWQHRSLTFEQVHQTIGGDSPVSLNMALAV